MRSRAGRGFPGGMSFSFGMPHAGGGYEHPPPRKPQTSAERDAEYREYVESTRARRVRVLRLFASCRGKAVCCAPPTAAADVGSMLSLPHAPLR